MEYSRIEKEKSNRKKRYNKKRNLDNIIEKSQYSICSFLLNKVKGIKNVKLDTEIDIKNVKVGTKTDTKNVKLH